MDQPLTVHCVPRYDNASGQDSISDHGPLAMLCALLLLLPSGSAVYELDVASGRVELVVAAPASGLNRTGSPAYSPDGEHIAFDATVDNAWNDARVFVWSRADGSLLDLGYGSHPTWLPGNKAVLASVRKIPKHSLAIKRLDQPLDDLLLGSSTQRKPTLEPQSGLLLTHDTRVPPQASTLTLTHLADLDLTDDSLGPAQIDAVTHQPSGLPTTQLRSLPAFASASAALRKQDAVVATLLAVTGGANQPNEPVALRQFLLVKDSVTRWDDTPIVVLPLPDGVSKLRVPTLSADGKTLAIIAHVPDGAAEREEVRLMPLAEPDAAQAVVRALVGAGIGSIALNADGSRLALISNLFYAAPRADGSLYDESDLEVTSDQ